MAKTARAAVVDTSTGEVVGDLYDGDRILRLESYNYLNSREKISADYVKLYLKSADALSRAEGMTTPAYKVCLRLLPYVRYDTGLIAHQNGEPLTAMEIVELFGDMCEKTVFNSLEEIVKHDVFAKVRRGKFVHYAANPYIFMRGAKVNKTLIKLFSKSDWAAMFAEQ